MQIRTVSDKQNEAIATLELMDLYERKVEFDYLRAFVITLVLFVHASLAYTTSAFFNSDYPTASSHPVVDEQRWIGFDCIVSLSETFSMSLLFFVSGLFVWQSLARKGPWHYFGDRLKRLGLPFVIGVLFLIPLAYYPAQLEMGRITETNTSYGAFWVGVVRSGIRTAGPFWFLWLLLAFNGLSAVLYRSAPLIRGFYSDLLKTILGRPVAFFGVLPGISMIVYLPIAIISGPLTWIGIGPFHAQAGRILLYLVYFITGVAIGARGVEHSVFNIDGALAKHWLGCVAVGLMLFMVFIIMVVVVTPMERTIVSEIAFVACGWAIVSGVISFFLRFAKRDVRILTSLSDNCYGIYIVHYVFITWLQFWLLGSDFVPLMKGTAVFAGTLILSWVLVDSIRNIPAIAKVI